MHVLHVSFWSLSGHFNPICYFSSRSSSSVYSTEVLSFASLLKENSYWVLILAITVSVTPEFTVCLCSLAVNVSLSPMGRTVHFFFLFPWKRVVWPERLCVIATFSLLKLQLRILWTVLQPLGYDEVNYWTAAHLMVPRGLPLQGAVGFLDFRKCLCCSYLSFFLPSLPRLSPPSVSNSNYSLSKCDFRNRKFLSLLKG